MFKYLKSSYYNLCTWVFSCMSCTLWRGIWGVCEDASAHIHTLNCVISTFITNATDLEPFVSFMWLYCSPQEKKLLFLFVLVKATIFDCICLCQWIWHEFDETISVWSNMYIKGCWYGIVPFLFFIFYILIYFLIHCNCHEFSSLNQIIWYLKDIFWYICFPDSLTCPTSTWKMDSRCPRNQ